MRGFVYQVDLTILWWIELTENQVLELVKKGEDIDIVNNSLEKKELRIGFVPYSPLCRGYLSGMLNEQTTFYAANDNRAGLPRYTPEAMKLNRPIVEALIDFGTHEGRLLPR